MADYYTFSGNVYDSSAAGTATFALTSSAGNPISYLQRSHIHVYLSDDDGDTWVEQARPAAWEFDAAATSIVLVTGITCLLYTSPSPRDRVLSRMPSSA